jgi:hypothetical protein
MNYAYPTDYNDRYGAWFESDIFEMLRNREADKGDVDETHYELCFMLFKLGVVK